MKHRRSKQIWKVLTICFAILFISRSCIQEDVFASETINNQARVGGSGIVYMEVKQSESLYQANAFIAWHPDFSGYMRNVSAYFFFNTTASLSVSVGGSVLSISYNPACSNGSGYSIASDPSRASRPAIMGDIYNVTYKVGRYNVNTNQWLSSGNEVRKEVKNIYNKAWYQ